MDATQAAEAKLRRQIEDYEKRFLRFGDNAAEVKLMLDELTRLRALREKQAAMIRRLEQQLDTKTNGAL